MRREYHSNLDYGDGRHDGNRAKCVPASLLTPRRQTHFARRAPAMGKPHEQTGGCSPASSRLLSRPSILDVLSIRFRTRKGVEKSVDELPCRGQ
jgi:hypothetical protein